MRNRSETMGKYGREKNKEDNVTKEDVSVSKNKRIKRVESFLSFHISAELLGPVSANIKVYSGSLKVQMDGMYVAIS